MSYEEAKDHVAIKRMYRDYLHFWSSNNYEDTLKLVDEAAELYAHSKFDQCYTDTCNSIKILTLFTFDVTKPEFKP